MHTVATAADTVVILTGPGHQTCRESCGIVYRTGNDGAVRTIRWGRIGLTPQVSRECVRRARA